MSVQRASRLDDTGKVVFGVWLHNVDHTFRFRGSIRWDRTLLDYDTWAESDFFKQGNALVNWSVATSTAGQITFSMDRPSSSSAAAGSGEVMVIRLKPRAGVTSGLSPVQWDAPTISDSNAHVLGIANSYGGSITITPP